MKLQRLLADRFLIALSLVAVVVAIVPLVSVVYYVTAKGLPAVNLNFFTQLPPLANTPGGGMGDAIQGTLILVGLSALIGVPIGLLSGIYISEYGRNWYGSTVSFLGDVLAGIPSIVTGILAYTLIVVPLHGFSVTAGSVALGTMMIPIVSNTSSQALKAVPHSIREASTALGSRRWRTTLEVVSNAKSGIATACLLAIARITGETAPLILTAGISNHWFVGFNQPVASLTYYVYYFATSPFANWRELAWGAALILMVIVLGINVVVRVVTRGKRAYS